MTVRVVVLTGGAPLQNHGRFWCPLLVFGQHKSVPRMRTREGILGVFRPPYAREGFGAQKSQRPIPTFIATFIRTIC